MFRLAAPALALATLLSCLLFGLAAACTSDADRGLPDTTAREQASRDTPETAEKKTLAASIPARDVSGKPVSDLPRYPGSVRVGYSEHRRDGLAVVRTAYLAEGRPARVRDFYTGVFHSRDWRLANVEYEGGEWSFLVARGGPEDGVEAGVEVSPGGGGSRVEVEFSRPWSEPRSGPESGPGSELRLASRDQASRDQEGSPSAGGSKR